MSHFNIALQFQYLRNSVHLTLFLINSSTFFSGKSLMEHAMQRESAECLVNNSEVQYVALV